MQDEVAIKLDAAQGKVTFEQRTLNGIELVSPPSVTLSVDDVLSLACHIIQQGIASRQRLNAGLRT